MYTGYKEIEKGWVVNKSDLENVKISVRNIFIFLSYFLALKRVSRSCDGLTSNMGE